MVHRPVCMPPVWSTSVSQCPRRAFWEVSNPSAGPPDPSRLTNCVAARPGPAALSLPSLCEVSPCLRWALGNALFFLFFFSLSHSALFAYLCHQILTEVKKSQGPHFPHARPQNSSTQESSLGSICLNPEEEVKVENAREIIQSSERHPKIAGVWSWGVIPTQRGGWDINSAQFPTGTWMEDTVKSYGSLSKLIQEEMTPECIVLITITWISISKQLLKIWKQYRWHACDNSSNNTKALKTEVSPYSNPTLLR